MNNVHLTICNVLPIGLTKSSGMLKPQTKTPLPPKKNILIHRFHALPTRISYKDGVITLPIKRKRIRLKSRSFNDLIHNVI